jgi:mercuric ion transport protein
MSKLRNTRAATPPAEAGRAAAKTTLATGALFAAFGVASCCALPLALGALGIGASALLGVAMMVGPYQREVLAAAVVCLLGATLLMWRRRRARACGVADASRRPVLDCFARIAVALAVGLLALTFWIGPPL